MPSLLLQACAPQRLPYQAGSESPLTGHECHILRCWGNGSLLALVGRRHLEQPLQASPYAVPAEALFGRLAAYFSCSVTRKGLSVLVVLVIRYVREHRVVTGFTTRQPTTPDLVIARFSVFCLSIFGF